MLPTLRHRAVLRAAAIALATGLFFLPPAAADGPAPSAVDPASLLAEGAGGTLAAGLSWSPDGSRLLYRLEADDGEDRLWLWSPGAEEPRAVLAPGDLGRSGDSLRGVSPLWMPDGSSLILASEGDLYRLALADGAAPERLTETEAEETDPQPSPDGERLAFVREHDLWLLDLSSGEERRLTHGGEKNVTLHGETDWVYWEELWGRDSEGYWWSPGSDQIAYYHFDEEPVALYPLLRYGEQYPEVESQKYPKAGTTNPRVRLGVLDLARGETTWLDTGWAAADGEDEAPYLARLYWRPDGKRVAVLRMNREQNRLDVLLCSPADGSCGQIASERWPTWVNIEDDFAFLEDGGFVWGSERTGWRHLYRYDATGAPVRPLSVGDWAVDSLLAVDEAAGQVIVRAYGEGPLGAAQRRILALPLAGGRPQTLAAEPGWNDAEVAPRGGWWVHSWSNADTPGHRAVRNPQGDEVLRLPAIPPTVDLAALPSWRIARIPGPDTSQLPAMTLVPEGAEGDRPAIMYHYGGPGSQVVADRWSSTRGLWHKSMALRGYVVLAVDNQASVYFGKRGEDRVHRRFGPTNLAGQLAGVAYLAERGDVDLSRVGLWGWSGGGSNTLYCLLSSPGTWRAGMAGAPVTDWYLYDTIWTERYLDHPDDNEEGYVQSSAVTHVDGLEDALLVVHGTSDDNVHPQNTLELSQKLVEAGKAFEQAIYPGQKHGLRGDSSRHFYRKMTRFFERELAAEPR